MIDRDTVDRIMSAANIVEVISDYITLKRKGANFQACCPFHNEKTPSFVVSPSKGLFKCFGCGKAGNAVTFVMEHESITYPEALKVVAKKYGIEIHEKEMTEEDIRRNDNRESMFALNSWVADYFVRYMKLPPKIWAFITPNDDGTYSIYLDPRRSREQQIEDYIHELKHILDDDFYNGLPIYICEDYLQ